MKIFKERPDYVLLAEILSKGDHSAMARVVFLKLAYDHRFRESSFTKAEKPLPSWPLANQIEAELGLELYVDNVDASVGRDHMDILVNLPEKEPIRPLEALLKKACCKPIDLGKYANLGKIIWQKQPNTLVVIFRNELGFYRALSHTRWLENIFSKRPDYALIGKILDQEGGTVSPRDLFVALKYDRRFNISSMR